MRCDDVVCDESLKESKRVDASESKDGSMRNRCVCQCHGVMKSKGRGCEILRLLTKGVSRDEGDATHGGFTG